MSNDLWASRLLMSQWPDSTRARDSSETTQLSITPAQVDTSGSRKEAYCRRPELPRFAPVNLQTPTWPYPTIKQGDRLCANLEELNKEGGAVSGALQMLENGVDFLLGISSPTT